MIIIEFSKIVIISLQNDCILSTNINIIDICDIE